MRHPSRSTKLHISYFLDWSGLPNDGVPVKVLSQIIEWRAQGADVELFLILPSKDLQSWENLDPNLKFFNYANRIGRVFARTRALICISLKFPSVLYLRHSIYFPWEVILIKSKSFILELNADNNAEYKIRSRMHAFLNSLSHNTLIRSAMGVCAVTKELAEMHEDKTAKGKIRVFSNGIRILKVEKITEKHSGINLMFLASHLETWHGFDILNNIAQEFPEYQFHYAGPRTDELTHSNIKQYGFLNGPVLDQLTAAMNFGIATLALYRKGLDTACPLKTSYYLSHNLPVIGNYVDSRIKPGSNFFLNLNLQINQNVKEVAPSINKFIKTWQDKKVPFESLSNFDIVKIEKDRMDFIRERIVCKEISKRSKLCEILFSGSRK